MVLVKSVCVVQIDNILIVQKMVDLPTVYFKDL